MEVHRHRYVPELYSARMKAYVKADIDEESIQYAKDNVALNRLDSRIKLVKTKPDGSLIPLDSFRLQRYTKRAHNID